jgi:hypothetical protein
MADDPPPFPSRTRFPFSVIVRRLGRRNPAAETAGQAGDAPGHPMSVKDTANAAFKKQDRSREGSRAMAKVQAERSAEAEKIERLKSLRLARTASEPSAPLKPKTGDA